MVVGGSDSLTAEIYDPEIDLWYYIKDVPYNWLFDQHGYFINWNGSPLLINDFTNGFDENMWKFEDGEWTLLEYSRPTRLDKTNFAITLPDNFIPDC